MSDFSDSEFEELLECEPAWLLRGRATAYRRSLLASGYSPLPVNGKAPPITGWQDIQATADAINDWEDKHANATNTGILTRITPAIDIDVLDPDVADELQKLAEHIVGISPVRIGQAPKRALLYRTDTPFDKLTTPIYISPDALEIWSGLAAKPCVGGAGDRVNGKALPPLNAEKAAEFLIAAERCMSARGWTSRKKLNGAASPACNGQTIASERERAYARAALDGCADELAQGAPGERNDTLNKKAFRLGTMVARSRAQS